MKIKERKRHCPGEDKSTSLNRTIRRVFGVGSVAAVLLGACLAEPTWARAEYPRIAFQAEHDKALHKIVAMSAFRLRFTRKGAASTGGGGPLAITYDNRLGTGVDASGWFTFGLRAGCRRIWVNSSGGSDSNNGLSAATAKATLNAAAALWLGGGYTAGDQLMIAGTGGRAYTDSGAVSLLNISGFSTTYPVAALTYDPADAANSAKYGKLVGPDVPTITFTGTSTLFDRAGNSGSNYGAVQGIQFDGGSVAGMQMIHNSPHSGLCFQNCRFKTIELGQNHSDGTVPYATTINISKCSFWGQWATDGNASGVYIAGTDGLYFQDNVLAHCGWKMGASRDDALTAGGAAIFGHGNYHSAHNSNSHFDRNVYVDSAADGLNLRGAATATQNVSLDEPLAGNIGGFSGAYTEAPSGVLITVDDWLIMGGANINSSNVRSGIGTSNTISGSYLNNVAMFDHPAPTQGTPYFGQNHRDNASNELPIDTYLTYSNFKGYHYANALNQTSGNTAMMHFTYTNVTLDVSAPGGSTWGSAPPAYQTRDQVITALLTAANIVPGASYTARKKQLVDAMLWRPDLQWASPLIAIGLPAMGLTPLYATTSAPDMTGQTPASIY